MKRIGPYVEEEEIARGGMGVIVSGFDPRLRRRSAVKLLAEGKEENAERVRRFVAEAQITGQLEHPNIVPVHQLGAHDGRPYLAMRQVHGVTLGDIIHENRRRLLEPSVVEDTLRTMLRVCDAVAYAHSKGVIHLDVKPANIMVGRFGQVYLMDWGLARLVGDTSDIELSVDPLRGLRKNQMLGTPAYMAPEMAKSEHDRCGPQTDVFLIAATIWHCLVGKPPYLEPTLRDTVYKAAMSDRPSLEEAAGDVPIAKQLVDILERAMAPKIEDRYASVEEMQRDLERFLRGGWFLPVREVSAGAVIYNQNDPGDAAYIIQRGRVEVFIETRTGRRAVRVMGPGEVFGEIAVLTGGARTAGVRAIDDVRLLVVDAQVLEKGLGLNSWLGAFVTTLAERFREADARLRRYERRGLATISPE
ncbi:MAG: cyclic nucleotide-binding domain-containing protein [Deltaproteobacteria bacterium]|nr:MAG: cyclic nucleotide-binding domain-containing protein [Deltaproteobacteria bacterium]